MIFKRVFHPVGQGAFFTEQFYDDDQDTLLYNIVYDCGSKSKDIGSQIECDIKNSFHGRKKIDVLFLSHFDDDHINYVKYLNDHEYLKRTKLFIPMLAAEEWLGIEPYATNFHYILALNENVKGGRKVIQVEFDEGNVKNDDEQLKAPRAMVDVEDDKIPSGTPLYIDVVSTGVFWYYTLFNVRFNGLIDELKQILGDDYAKLSDKSYVMANVDKLKRIYHELGSNPSKGTAINLNSLLVMSYPSKSDCCKDYGNRTVCNAYYNEWFRWNRSYTRYWLAQKNIHAGSCLYTGDTSANLSSVWKRIEQMIKLCLGNGRKLSLIQIPHHGSKYSYDKRIVESEDVYAGFTNYDPFYWQPIFDVNLPAKFAMQKKPLILVTKEDTSRFEEYWRL